MTPTLPPPGLDPGNDAPDGPAGPRTLAAALAYAAAGLPVFPVHGIRDGRCTCGKRDCASPGKHPCTPHGLKDATTDPAVLRAWLARWPDANLALATGAASGLLVLDVDPRHGGTLERLARAVGPLGGTARVKTGGGGWHLYFALASGGPADPAQAAIRSGAETLGAGLDVRANGGYLLVPPSRHISGARYTWEADTPLAAAPPRLLDTLRMARGRRGTGDAALKAPAQAAAAEAAALNEPAQGTSPGGDPSQQGLPAGLQPADHAQQPADHAQRPPVAQAIPSGRRNATLASMAGGMRRVGFSEAAIAAALLATNRERCDPPLPDDEARAIAASIGRYDAGGLQPATGEPVRLATVTAAELLARTLPPMRWAVPKLLPEGLTLLAGKPKMGKSWLAMNLAVGIAGDGPALGSLEVEHGPVLYLSLEDQDRRLQKRLRIALGAMGIPLALEIAWRCPRLDAGGLALLEEWLAAHPDARLVIVDTLAKVRPARRVGASIYDEDYAVMSALKRVADERRVSMLVITHLRKGGAEDPQDEISGSTGLTGAADGTIVVKRARGAKAVTLHLTGRDVEEQELAAEFDPSAGLWSLTGKAEDVRRSQERRDILRVLAEAGNPLSPKEVAAALDRDGSRVGWLLWKMSSAGEVECVGYGRYALPQEPEVTRRAQPERATYTPPILRRVQRVSRPQKAPTLHRRPNGGRWPAGDARRRGLCASARHAAKSFGQPGPQFMALHGESVRSLRPVRPVHSGRARR